MIVSCKLKIHLANLGQNWSPEQRNLVVRLLRALLVYLCNRTEIGLRGRKHYINVEYKVTNLISAMTI